MPVEGQQSRPGVPLRRRDKRVLLVFACAVALAIAGGLAAYLSRSHDRSDAGCIVVTVPSTMGGSMLRSCGDSAKTFCRTRSRLDRSIAAACRRKGYATG
jgi:hypothetical protein